MSSHSWSTLRSGDDLGRRKIGERLTSEPEILNDFWADAPRAADAVDAMLDGGADSAALDVLQPWRAKAKLNHAAAHQVQPQAAQPAATEPRSLQERYAAMSDAERSEHKSALISAQVEVGDLSDIADDLYSDDFAYAEDDQAWA